MAATRMTSKITCSRLIQPTAIEPVYRFANDGQVEFPAEALPGGGRVAVAGINATAGSVRLFLEGLSGEAAGGRKPELSLDVTAKPLIALVWYGLYIVLAGGLLSFFSRVRTASD